MDASETLIPAPSHRWKRMLEEGRYRSAAEIAEAEGVTRSFDSRLMPLTLFAPDIVEAILDGRQPEGTAARGTEVTHAHRLARAALDPLVRQYSMDENPG